MQRIDQYGFVRGEFGVCKSLFRGHARYKFVQHLHLPTPLRMNLTKKVKTMKHKYSKMPQSCTEIIRCYLIRRNIDGRFLYSWDPTNGKPPRFKYFRRLLDLVDFSNLHLYGPPHRNQIYVFQPDERNKAINILKTVEACFPKLRGQLSLYERVDSVNWRATWPTTRTGIETTSA